jgi:hypothetical protein
MQALLQALQRSRLWRLQQRRQQRQTHLILL